MNIKFDKDSYKPSTEAQRKREERLRNHGRYLNFIKNKNRYNAMSIVIKSITKG